MSSVAKFAKEYALPLWKWYLAGGIFLAATNYITMRIPQLGKSIVNGFRDGNITDEHRSLAVVIILLGITIILVRALSRLAIFWPGRVIEAESKDKLFEKMMSLPSRFYEKFGMGELISRLSNDINMLRAFFAFGVLQLFNLVFLVFFMIYQMLSVHPTLTLVCLSPLIGMVFSIRYLTNMLHQVSKENQDATGRLTNRVTEAFVNIHVIKANSSEKTFLDNAEIENKTVYKTNLKSIMIRTVFFPLMTFLMFGSQVLVFLYGGYEVQNGRLTIGDILAFNIYLAFLSFPITAAGIIASLYNRCVAALDRISVIENESPETAQPGVSLENENKPLLEIKNLNFTYDNEETKFSLRNISLSIEKGKKIGIYGPIGSGKTTLLNVIARLYEPPQNTIFYSGKDITTFQPNDYRKHLAYAQQSVFLFSDSIRNNLMFGIENYEDDIIFEALRHADILEEVLSFPDGLETEIGERGVKLSGGQKQRIALARVFLRKAEIFLFDDVLSAVDYESESRLINYFAEKKMTYIIVSHRPSVLETCDEVFILMDGVITNRGRYSEVKIEPNP